MCFTKSHKALVGVSMLYFFSFPVFSQTTYSNNPSSTFSFTLGLTSTKLINDTGQYKAGILFNGGFIYSTKVSKKININLECLYSGKSLKQDSPIIKYRYYYIDIPLYAQLKMGEKTRINAGSQYSSFINSQVIFLDGSKKNGINIEKYRDIKPNDWSFLVGAEIDIKPNLALAVRYTISGSTFFEKNGVNFGVFQLSFNYCAFKSYKQLFHKTEKISS